MGLTNYPNGISSFGIPVIGNSMVPSSPGKYYWVDYTNGSNGNTGLSPKKAFKTVKKAYDTTTDGNDDVICLIGSAAHPLAAMLTVSKSRVHFVGIDGSFGRMYGQNAKIDLGVTAVATDVAVIKNTGVRNTFTNIKFRNTNTKAESIYTLVDAGEYATYYGCEFYHETLLTAEFAEVVANGDSSQFYSCVFGSLANLISGAYIQPCLLVTAASVVAGTVMRDNYFKDCQFWRRAGHVNNRFVYGTNASDVQRMLLMNNCSFVTAKNSTAVPADAVGFGAAQTVGTVLLKDCASVNNTVMAEASRNIYVAGSVPTFATTGVAVAA
jgi:hypothetical protein